ncbi:MAG: type I-U CRISPR-associated RAMP protein Csb1/Cas7u [Bacillota bacterium]|nr:type I-U CRISPR-associated RAMP protein Csb1/Cas7u [Bacillota bacterium]
MRIMTESQVQENDLNKAIELLDRLLSVNARKPGAAVKLPAVIRVLESLEPAGGMDFPVFPASYAGTGDNDPPVYDLSGVVYGQVQETVRGKGKTTVQRQQIISAERCALDSPQSQANRMEEAFLEDSDLRSLVPQATVTIPRSSEKKSEESVLRLPHRVADFRVRLSNKKDDVKIAIGAFANGDVSKLLKLMPTSIVFGFWDSRAEEWQHKHARILLSRIDAFDVVPCRRHALYSGPYSADEFAKAVLDKPAAEKSDQDKMAERGYTNAPTEGLGGVLVKGRIERLALISLTDIARLNCRDEDNKTDKTDAARRYLFALAALAEAYPRSTGSHRLRSGCELLTVSRKVELRGGDGTYAEEGALKKLYEDRRMLIAVAKQAKGILEIPDQTGPFVLTKESLREDFRVASATGATPPPANPAQGGASKPARRHKEA